MKITIFAAFFLANLAQASTTFYCTATSASMTQGTAANGYQHVTVVMDGNQITATRIPDSAVLVANASKKKNIYTVDQNASSFSQTDDNQLYLDSTVKFDEHEIDIGYHGPEAILNADGKHKSYDNYLNCNTTGWTD
jgi:hypothetical protein